MSTIYFRGEALQSMVQLMGSKNLYEYYHDDWKVHNIDWTIEKANTVLDLWMQKFTKVRIFVMLY